MVSVKRILSGSVAVAGVTSFEILGLSSGSQVVEESATLSPPFVTERAVLPLKRFGRENFPRAFVSIGAGSTIVIPSP